MHVMVTTHLGRSLEFNRVVEIYSSCFMIRRFQVLVLYSASSIEVLLPAVIFPHLRVNIPKVAALIMKRTSGVWHEQKGCGTSDRGVVVSRPLEYHFGHN